MNFKINRYHQSVQVDRQSKFKINRLVRRSITLNTDALYDNSEFDLHKILSHPNKGSTDSSKWLSDSEQ